MDTLHFDQGGIGKNIGLFFAGDVILGNKLVGMILVGGLGTRLRPLTYHKPKPLLPICNKPFLSYQFHIMKKAGIKDVVLAASGLFRPWRNSLSQICPAGLQLHFSFEKKLLGTGGAIRFAYDSYQNKVFSQASHVAIFNGDVLFDYDLKEFVAFHRKNKSSVSIALTPVSDPSRFGLVITDQTRRIRDFKEKPKRHRGKAFINAGAYVFNQEMIRLIPPRKVVSVERDVFPKWVGEGHSMFGYRTSGYWNDIGTPETYLQAHLDLMKPKNLWTKQVLLTKRTPTGRTYLIRGNRVKIDPKAQLRGKVCLGDRVRVLAGAVIHNSVIMDDCLIREKARLSHVVLGPHCQITKESHIPRGSIFGKGTVYSSRS